MFSKFFLVRFLCALIAFSVVSPSVVEAQDSTKSSKKKKSSKKTKKEEPPPEEPETESEATAEAEELEAAVAEEVEAVVEEEPAAESVFATSSIADIEAEKRAEKIAAERIPREANFSGAGLVLDTTVLALGGVLTLMGQDLVGTTDPSFGAPQRGSWDYDISLKFHGDLAEGSGFLFGVGDIAGYAVIGVPALALGSTYLWLMLNEEPILATQSRNVDHAFWGFFRTMAWTSLSVGITKTLFARQRPYQAFVRTAYGDSDVNDSFVSTLTTFAFASASYSSWGLRDWMVNDLGYSNVAGTLIPFGTFYGLATLTAVAQIYQQEAYLSDVVVGGLIGSLVGNLVYATHFDHLGTPETRISTLPYFSEDGAGLALSGRF